VILTEIGFCVAIGVLIDTIIVRSVPVTALNLDPGDRIWWPSRLAGPAGQVTGAPGTPVTTARRYAGAGVRFASIWSKSPNPLKVPPPPDHCHITALLSELVTPPKNRAQVVVRRRHQPSGVGWSWLVSAR
jgi:hypothetical protein